MSARLELPVGHTVSAEELNRVASQTYFIAYNTSQRDALSAVRGQLCSLPSLGRVDFYDGSDWRPYWSMVTSTSVWPQSVTAPSGSRPQTGSWATGDVPTAAELTTLNRLSIRHYDDRTTAEAASNKQYGTLVTFPYSTWGHVICQWVNTSSGPQLALLAAPGATFNPQWYYAWTQVYNTSGGRSTSGVNDVRIALGADALEIWNCADNGTIARTGAVWGCRSVSLGNHTTGVGNLKQAFALGDGTALLLAGSSTSNQVWTRRNIHNWQKAAGWTDIAQPLPDEPGTQNPSNREQYRWAVYFPGADEILCFAIRYVVSNIPQSGFVPGYSLPLLVLTATLYSGSGGLLGNVTGLDLGATPSSNTAWRNVRPVLLSPTVLSSAAGRWTFNRQTFTMTSVTGATLQPLATGFGRRALATNRIGRLSPLPSQLWA